MKTTNKMFVGTSDEEFQSYIDGTYEAWNVWDCIPWHRPDNWEIDAFTKAYIVCALWSSIAETTDSEGEETTEAMDANHDWTDLTDSTLGRMIADCKRFQEHVDRLFLIMECVTNIDVTWESVRVSSINSSDGDFDAYAGHDFWLTRNGYGAGFWDGDWQKDVGEQLTQLSKSFGECNLYIGDDGKIYS